MDKFTHIVPVGHTKETLISSITKSADKYPLNKVILVLGINEQDASEQKARKIAVEVEKSLGSLGLISCERISTDLFDVLTAANDLVKTARTEKKAGNNVVFNISGFLRTIDVAGYIASLITESESIVGVPGYIDGKITGVKYFHQIAPIPIIKLSAPKVAILALLGVEEWKPLIQLSLDYDTGSKIKPGSKKSKISFHLKELRELKLVETMKKDKQLLLRLTKLGLVYYNGFKEI